MVISVGDLHPPGHRMLSRNFTAPAPGSTGGAYKGVRQPWLGCLRICGSFPAVPWLWVTYRSPSSFSLPPRTQQLVSGTSAQSCCVHQLVRGRNVPQFNFPLVETVPFCLHPQRSPDTWGSCLDISEKDMTPGPSLMAGNPELGRNCKAAEPLQPGCIPCTPAKGPLNFRAGCGGGGTRKLIGSHS